MCILCYLLLKTETGTAPRVGIRERDGERSSVRNRDNDPQQRRIAPFIYNVEWKHSDAIMGFNQIC